MRVTGAYLGVSSSALFGKPLPSREVRKVVKDYFVSDLSEWVRENEAVNRKLINSCDTVRLPAVEFQLFFWRALRLKLMESCFGQGKVFMPLSSWQVFQACKGFPRFNFDWLEEFHEEYRKDLAGMPSDSEAYFQRAIAALGNLYS
jgi:hypothetical protein